ncbi:MAG: glycoside hydrolase family 36 protein [Verrucomicrobiota bacterium]
MPSLTQAPDHVLSCIDTPNMIIRYLKKEEGAVGLQLIPRSMVDQIVEHKNHLVIPHSGKYVDGSRIHPLVVLHLEEDPWPHNWSQGRTLQHSPSTTGLIFQDQERIPNTNGFDVVTRLRGERDFACTHILRYFEDCDAVQVKCTFHNSGNSELTLLMISSFSLSSMTPFCPDNAVGRLALHRFRSSWSLEGRHVIDDVEDLHLESSWTSWNPASERFGQIGSMPARGFFPTAAIEDKEVGVFWGAQLGWLGSWQMEAIRYGDHLALTGGLADWEFGHWRKQIDPGETFETPWASLATCEGNIDQLCDQFNAIQKQTWLKPPACERNLPIVFNEWCTSWGNPTEQSILSVAERLKDTAVKYLVIDAGWSAKESHYSNQASNGDWEIETSKFPNGFKELNQTIRNMGLIPGIWFEFEVCTEGANAYLNTQHHLHRHRKILDVGNRRYWDFRDPWVIDYLSKKLIRFLDDQGFGYLKVDYNDNIGVGCDSPDGLGEGLRQHLEGVYQFFQKVRQELPELVIENCASGGHRLEPMMIGVTSMSSFSDAHESQEIPIIAANLHRLMPPERSQIWAVLRNEDSIQRLYYSLSAAFLGRLCLSGNIDELPSKHWDITQRAMEFYRKVWHLIANGTSQLYREGNGSMRTPCGSQAVLRHSSDETEALVVWHAFGRKHSNTLSFPLPNENWEIAESFAQDVDIHLSGTKLEITGADPWSGGVTYLRKKDR